MAGGEHYRIKAAEIQALAETEISESGRRAEYMQLAKGYLLLAELAERNQTNDIVYETPPNRDSGHSSEDNDAFDPASSKSGDSGVNV